MSNVQSMEGCLEIVLIQTVKMVGISALNMEKRMGVFRKHFVESARVVGFVGYTEIKMGVFRRQFVANARVVRSVSNMEK
jgi:hypothetical protein